MNDRAGTVATPDDLTDIPALLKAYYDVHPDPTTPKQRVVFGTSGHRGSAFDGAFNEDHILATTQAIVDYRTLEGTDGPLFLGADSHALSEPALRSALEVLVANDVAVLVDAHDAIVPTPALSHAILQYNAGKFDHLSDGIIVTPSHNPPRDGGFKYNPTNGGPADTDATKWIAARANEYLQAGLNGVHRTTVDDHQLGRYDFLRGYVDDLPNIIDIDAIKSSSLHIAADPLGGASVHYWQAIADTYGIDLTVVNPVLDPAWSFMTLDWDGKIRMDPSSKFAMAGAIERQAGYDLLTGNDADSDRHGIVTTDGLMNPNHYLAVAIDYLYRHRDGWSPTAGVGKTLVSSSIIDHVAASLGRKLVEVPVGFKWFVPGLISGDIGFGGEESAGASFLRKNGTVWTTDKDGILLALLASEIMAVTGESPSERYVKLTEQFGDPAYERIDAPASPEQKAALAKLDPSAVTASTLAGDPITDALTTAPGNGAAFGGLKVVTDHAWFAARPSGTEDVMKIYAESFRGPEHLHAVQDAAQAIVNETLASI